MTRIVEADICIIGGGITAAMVAEKVSQERDVRIVVVEAGDETVPLERRAERRQRTLDYGENPWLRDHIEDQTARGMMSRSMGVGGLAMHWGGTVPRFTPEDFRLRSMYGVGDDWPVDYDALEPFYQEAEERIGVAGHPGPPELNPRQKPFPMPGMPLSWNLERLKEWGERSGIPFWGNPVAKATVPYDGRSPCQRCDTCQICPTGAKYTPDFAFLRMIEAGRMEMLTRTLVRRLVLEEGSHRIHRAEAVDRDNPQEPVHFLARTFVLAAGYTWSPHLLLLSTDRRFPDGLANRSGMVGRYMTGHRSVGAQVEVPMQLFPGMYARDSLLSTQFQRPGSQDHYLRHDLRIWESTVGRVPRLRGDDGGLLLGDEILDDWRVRTTDRASARLRAYYDVIPDRESRLTLDAGLRNRWGDPLPSIQFVDAPESVALRGRTEESIRQVFAGMVRAGGGTILSQRVDDTQDHPGGGCRMGDDPATSVVDGWGRTHDHENLFVVGAPTLVSGGCANGTLTFAALSLRSAEEIGRDFSQRRS